MVDIGSITAAVGGARTAIDIVRSMIGLSEAVAVNTKAAELLTVIADVQIRLVESQQVLLQLQAENTELRTQLDQSADFSRYRLVQFPSGAQLYVVREEFKGDEPDHCICPNCRNTKNVKSILQCTDEVAACPNCEKRFQLRRTPESWSSQGDYDTDERY